MAAEMEHLRRLSTEALRAGGGSGLPAKEGSGFQTEAAQTSLAEALQMAQRERMEAASLAGALQAAQRAQEASAAEARALRLERDSYDTQVADVRRLHDQLKMVMEDVTSQRATEVHKYQVGTRSSTPRRMPGCFAFGSKVGPSREASKSPTRTRSLENPARTRSLEKEAEPDEPKKQSAESLQLSGQKAGTHKLWCAVGIET